MARKVIIATHDGMFHADDVFAVAVLLRALEKAPVLVSVVRTREPALIAKADFVADVGSEYDAERNRFDHHQIGGAGIRPNGIPFASFGLVWKKFGAVIAGSARAAAWVDEILAAPIDANDSGVDLFQKNFPDVEPYTVHEYIQSLRPTWREDARAVDERFLEAVAFARKVIEREVARAGAGLAAEGLLRKAYADAPDKRIILLDAFYPSEKILSSLPEPLFVVFPRPDGTWTARAVRDDASMFKNRKDFPLSWAGLRDAELAGATGVPDAVFCHAGRFMVVAKSQSGAVALARLALRS